MPTPYFSKFPKTTYDMDGSGATKIIVTDIIHKARFIDVVRSNGLIFYTYTVKDGDTPEIIASKLYDSPQYHWIVLYANNIMNLWTDWPLSYDQFIAYLETKYGSVDTSQTTVDHYEDVDGNYIDLDSYNDTVSDGSVIVYAFENEIRLNDLKKDIQLLEPKYVSFVEAELDKLMIRNT